MATRPERRLTYEDYVHFPKGERWEVIDGEPHVVPGANRRHQQICVELTRQVANYLKAHGGGEVYAPPFDVVLDPSDIHQPDLVFVSDADRHVLTEANIWGTPTWVVEVLSRTHPERDRRLKLQRYEKFGVPEYWIVDPVETFVEIHRLDAASYDSAVVVRPPDHAEPRLPVGLAIDLGELFASG